MSINKAQAQKQRAYLAAMGIQTWLPRINLPHSKLTWHRPDPASTVHHQNQLPPPIAASQPVVTSPVPLSAANNTDPVQQQQHPTQTTTANANPPQPPVQVTAAEQTKTTVNGASISQFRLVVQAISDDTLAVMEMPYTGLVAFSRFHQRLLNDLLRALQLPNRTVATSNTAFSPPMREFTWPLHPDNSQGLLERFSQNDREAATAVHAFLTNQFGLARQRLVLLLGQAAARFVIDPTQSLNALRGIHAGPQAGQYLAVSYSLHELMKLPQLKAEAWQDLQPLQCYLPAPVAQHATEEKTAVHWLR